LFGLQSNAYPSACTMLFSPKTGNYVVTRASSNVCLCDTKTGAILYRATLSSSFNKTDPLFGMNDAETKLLIKKDFDAWKVVDCKTLKSTNIQMRGRRSAFRGSVDAALTPAGDKVVASIRDSPTYTTYDTLTGQALQSFPSHPYYRPLKVCLEENKRLLVCDDFYMVGNCFTLYDHDEKKVLCTTSKLMPHDTMRSAQMDNKKERCLLGSVNYPYYLMTIKDGALQHPFKDAKSRDEALKTEYTDSGGVLNDGRAYDAFFAEKVKYVGAYWGPQEKSIITTDWTGDINIYDANSNELTLRLPGAGHRISFSSDGSWAVTHNHTTHEVEVRYVP